MRRTFLWSKIHRVTVTGTDVDYEGSLSLDPELMEAADMRPFEKIDVYDVNNGERFSTYLIPGEPGSGVCMPNGAAAHKTAAGHQVILASYVDLEADEIEGHAATILLVDGRNRVRKRSREVIRGTAVA